MSFVYAGRYSENLLRPTAGSYLAAVTSADVTVFESDGTTEATLYSDRDKTAGTNPVSPDALGNLEFFADPGTYVLSVNVGGSIVATDTVVVAIDTDDVVTLTGDQSLEGVKDFGSAPTVGGDVAPGSMLDYAESSAGHSFPGTTLDEVDGMVVTFTLASAATVKLSASALAAHTSADSRIAIYITDDSDDSIVDFAQAAASTAGQLWTLNCFAIVVLAAGTHTFRLDGRSPAGAGGSLSVFGTIRLLAERIA